MDHAPGLRILTALMLASSLNLGAQLATDGLTPPVATKIPKDVTVHGDRRIDDYFWLRDKANPAVIDYLKSENAYTEAVMAPTKPLQDTLYKEMVGRIKETDSSAAYPDGDWLYYSRTEQGKQYRIYCRKLKALADAPEVVTLDLNALGAGLKFIGLGDYEVSDDGNFLAYSTDTTGHRDYDLYVKDLRTGELVPQSVGKASGIVWASDNKTLFYTQEDPISKRSHLLGRCDLATGKPQVLLEEKDELYSVGVGRSDDRKFIFCTVASKRSSEVRALTADAPLGEWTLIEPRKPERKYRVEHRDGLFYIVTNKDAENYKVVTAPVATPGEDHWTDFVAADAKVKVSAVSMFHDYAVVSEREAGLPQIEVINLKTGERHRVEFPEPSYEASLATNAEYDTAQLRYSYTSPVTAPSVFSYDMGTRKSVLVKQDEVLGGYSPSNYACERVMAPASDGTLIPVTLVYQKSLRKSGPQPLLLYGYGSYGLSIPDSFSSARLSLLDRGVIFAVAHIRGGGELGEPWRDAGRMERKMTTFTDFIACAEYLEKSGYSTKEKLGIYGGSAGGLLLGAVANLRPDLYKCVVSKVPFVDVINTMLDASLPLTTGEYIEWGNPNVAAEYGWIRAYSPYDNVKAQAYPATLVTTALNDSQVPYWEGSKLVAKLRATKTDSNPLLLKISLDPAGHGGSSGRYDALRETAFDYAFVLSEIRE
ncbi:MAG TPA: S9 family peptidase [Opitutaceae bacterium]|jgi:oligopeptidase B|nr:S9 family peptidase [Opitutaceae bacterium]